MHWFPQLRNHLPTCRQAGFHFDMLLRDCAQYQTDQGLPSSSLTCAYSIPSSITAIDADLIPSCWHLFGQQFSKITEPSSSAVLRALHRAYLDPSLSWSVSEATRLIHPSLVQLQRGVSPGILTPFMPKIRDCTLHGAMPTVWCYSHARKDLLFFSFYAFH